MRTFDPDFQAELERDNPDVFHGVELETGDETIRVVKRTGGAEFDGNEFIEGLEGVSPMASQASPGDRSLDVQQIDVAITNALGAIPPGTRLSRRLPKSIEGQESRLDLYAYTEHELDPLTGKQVPVLESLKREKLYAGIPQLGTGEGEWDPETQRIRLAPILAKYLDKPICEVLSPEDYPFGRSADLGKAIGVAVGNVKGYPGRVTKASFASLPEAAIANVGSGALARPLVILPANNRTYTVTITSPETVAFAGPGNADTHFSFNDGASPKAHVQNQSFTLAATQSVVGVRCRVKRTAGSSPTIGLRLLKNNAGVPENTFSEQLRFASASWTSSYADSVFTWAPISLSAGTYWLQMFLGFSATLSQGSWHRATGGGYAGGTAKHGEGSGSVVGGEIDATYDTTLNGSDFMFTLLIEGSDSVGFSVSATTDGAQGSGTIDEDFDTSNGDVTIRASDWSGLPAGGDVFTFSVDNSSNEVVFADSPAATPCEAIGNLRWNGVPVGSGTTVQQTTDASFINFGRVSTVYAGLGQSMPVQAGLYTRMRAKVSRTLVAPEAPLTFELRTDANGVPSAEVLRSGELQPTDLTTTATLLGITFDEPLAWKGGALWLVVRTTSRDDTHFYVLRHDNDTGSFTGGLMMGLSADTGGWVAISAGILDMVFELTAATVSLDNSDADYAGVPRAKAEFSIDIPDDVIVTADIVGETDDSSGTYTGSASALNNIPADYIHYLAARAGMPAGNIDSPVSFLASRAAAGSIQRLNGVFDTVGQTVLHGMLDIAFQARSMIDYSVDLLRFIYLEDDPAVVATIGWGDVVDENTEATGPRKPAIKGNRTKAETWLINRIELRYRRDWSRSKGAAAYLAMKAGEDAASITDYGLRQKDPLFFCDHITTEAFAQDTLDYYLATRAEQKDEDEILMPLSWAGLEKGDVVVFDLPEETVV